MKKKRPAQSGDGPKRQGRSGVSLHVYIDPALAGDLQAYLDATEPAVSKTAAVETALRDFLRVRRDRQ